MSRSRLNKRQRKLGRSCAPSDSRAHRSIWKANRPSVIYRIDSMRVESSSSSWRYGADARLCNSSAPRAMSRSGGSINLHLRPHDCAPTIAARAAAGSRSAGSRKIQIAKNVLRARVPAKWLAGGWGRGCLGVRVLAQSRNGTSHSRAYNRCEL